MYGYSARNEVSRSENISHKEQEPSFQWRIGADAAYVLPGKLLKNVPNTLSTVYTSLPHLLGNVYKEWLLDISNAPDECIDGPFDKNDAVLPFPQTAMAPQEYYFYLILLKDDVSFLCLMVFLTGCVQMIIDLGIKT